jgi:hypothetical protein
MSTALIVRDDSQLSVVITAEATQLKEAALESASLVCKVANATQNENAVAALTEIKRVKKLVEESRQAAKAPILDFGRAIDTAAKTFSDPLTREEMRINRLVGDFQALEEAKKRDAEIARRKELEEIERKKFEALSQAQSHEEREAIQERACEEAKALPVAAPVRAQGQVVSEVWSFEVTDIWTLARAHPTCVKIEARPSEIKALLSAGAQVVGVKAWKETKATVRLQREPLAIEA